MQKEIENIEFFQGVNIELMHSLKNIGTKLLIFFRDSSEKI